MRNHAHASARRGARSLALAVLVTLALLTSWLGLVPDALAQPARVTEQLDSLRAAVDELRAQTVQVPTLAAVVQEVSEHVTELERRLGELERSQASIPDAVARLDQLQSQVEVLQYELASVRAEMANITQTSAAPASQGEGVAYKNKYAWSTGDGRYALAISGYMHARYQLHADDDGVRESTLRMRRARVGLDGHLGSSALRYNFVISAIRSTPLLDYHFDYQLRPAITIRVGQYKTQFTREFITSSTRRPFFEEPLAISLLRYDRDVQVGVYGTVLDDRLGYYAGVGNGAGANRVDDNLDMALNARLDAVVLGSRFKYGYGDVGRTATPTLMIGAGVVHDLTPMPGTIGDLTINTDVDGDGDTDNVRVLSASADAVFRYQGLEASVEAVFRKESFGTILQHADNTALLDALGGGDDHTYVNVFGQLTYVLPMDLRSHRLLLGARAGRSRVPFLGVGGRASQLPAGDTALDVDGLVQLYDSRGLRFVGAHYTAYDYAALTASDGSTIDGTGGTEHRLIVETQLVF